MPRTRPVRVASLLAACALLLCCTSARADDSTDRSAGDPPAEPPAEASAREAVSWLVVPVVAYTPETSGALAAMGMVFVPNRAHPNTRPDAYSAALVYTLRRQSITYLNSQTRFRGGDLVLVGMLQARKWREDYFGIGSQVGQDSTKFLRREIRARAGLRKELWWDALYAGAFVSGALTGVDQTSEALREDSPHGLDGGRLMGVGLELFWDRRDSPIGPRHGFFFNAEIEAWHHVLASDFDALSFRLDSRRYFDLGHNQTLALQVVWRAQRGQVPFYRLNTLGGGALLRGIFEGRFRDRDLAAAQVEYRSPAYGRLSGAAFAGLGAVSPGSDYQLKDAHWAAGLGARVLVNRQRNVNIRLDAGVSKDDYGVYFSLGEAF